jgi:hypothetical protein
LFTQTLTPVEASGLQWFNAALSIAGPSCTRAHSAPTSALQSVHQPCYSATALADGSSTACRSCTKPEQQLQRYYALLALDGPLRPCTRHKWLQVDRIFFFSGCYALSEPDTRRATRRCLASTCTRDSPDVHLCAQLLGTHEALPSTLTSIINSFCALHRAALLACYRLHSTFHGVTHQRSAASCALRDSHKEQQQAITALTALLDIASTPPYTLPALRPVHTSTSGPKRIQRCD